MQVELSVSGDVVLSICGKKGLHSMVTAASARLKGKLGLAVLHSEFYSKVLSSILKDTFHTDSLQEQLEAIT